MSAPAVMILVPVEGAPEVRLLAEHESEACRAVWWASRPESKAAIVAALEAALAVARCVEVTR